jgi:WD40 repeat protein
MSKGLLSRRGNIIYVNKMSIAVFNPESAKKEYEFYMGSPYSDHKPRELVNFFGSKGQFTADGLYVMWGGMFWDLLGNGNSFFSDLGTLYALSPGGRYLLTGRKKWSDNIDHWDVIKKKKIHEMPSDKFHVNFPYLWFSPNDEYRVVHSQDGLQGKMQIRTINEEVLNLGDPSLFLLNVAFSSDSEFFVTAGGDFMGQYRERPNAHLCLWKRDGKIIHDLKGHNQIVTVAALSADGKQIASAHGDQLDSTVIMWDAGSGRERYRLKPGKGTPTVLAFSPDGNTLLTGNEFGRIILYDVSTANQKMELIAHHGNVSSASFSPDGRFILTTADTESAYVWSAAAGKWLCKLSRFYDDGWTWLVLSPDGRFDTNNLEEIKGIHWIMPDDPLRPLPLEIFMRDYYEPRLLPRILDGEEFRPIRALQDLNRVQPEVKITRIEAQKNAPDKVSVTVEVSKAKGEFLQEDKKVTLETGVYDLRLFRDGQLVSYEPQKGGGIAVPNI